MAAAVTIHIRPTATLAERALLPDDPGAALSLAQALVDRPLMFNHHRGLWGYTGTAADGAPLTVQSTGIGGLSAATVLDELVALGLRRAIRVGSCAALATAAELELGDLLIVTEASAGDGPSRALGARERIGADPGLTAALRAAEPEVRHGLVASLDLFYRPDGGGRWDGAEAADGALAVELEAAALLALGARRGIAVGCVLAVGELLGSGRRLYDDGLAAAVERAGRLGLRGLPPR